MDLAAFAKEQFSAKDWVNNTFRQPESQTNPENFASSIVMKLQLAIFEINSSLESTSASVIQNLPRLVRDIELLQNEVVHFQRKLNTVEEEVSKVEHETTHSLDYIIKLDSVKKRLKETSKALQEADNWTTLMADIEELFESNDLMALSQRINSLRQSLDLLHHVSDYGHRMMQLDGLRNRLEALASPTLVSAISSGDAAKTTVMVQVFTNMDRLDQLLQYYTKCRRGVLLQQWKELCGSDDSANMVELLDRFHRMLLDDIQEQTKWYQSVFNQQPAASGRIILPIYSQALSALDPNPLHHIEYLMKKPASAAGSLALLRQIKASADRLLDGVTAHFKDSGSPSGMFEFTEALYQTFRLTLSSKYKTLCYQHLVEHFHTPESIGENHHDIADRIHSLRRNHSKISSLIESTLSDCTTLTSGCGLELLIDGWNRFLIQHLQEYTATLEMLRKMMGGQSGSEDSLHTALSLLQTLGELLIVLEENDITLAGHVTNSRKRLEQDGQCKSLYLEAQPLERLDHLFSVQDGNAIHSFLNPSVSVVMDLNAEIQRCIYDTLMDPIRRQVGLLGSPEWAAIISGSQGLTEDLPEFGLAPMEYITQIGQYLMMLPQHLEPFVLQENRGLTRALAENTFPHGRQSAHHPSADPSTLSATDFLLSWVAAASASALSESILRIESVGSKGAKQIAADIDYLGNIFEDLGLALPASLIELVDLFRAAASSILSSDVSGYKTASHGKDHRLVAAVRSITNLPSSD